jgi:MFS family permease
MPRLSRPATFAYSAGQFAAGLYFAFNSFILSLYLSQYTRNNILIGWLSSTRSFEQSVTQPIVGAASDRLWTRFGRRAPFFLLAMPIVAVLLIFNGLLPVPANPTEPAHLWLVVVTIFLFSLIFNIGIDPYYALLVDVTSSEQRGRKSGWAQMGGFLGQCVLLVLAIFLWTKLPFLVWLTVALGLVAGFGIVALGVRERRERVHEVHERPGAHLSHIRRGRDWVERHPKFAHALRLLHVYRPGVGLVAVGVGLVLYGRALVAEQREASKLLGVRFLYQFGINAAVPFLTLFLRDEIGTNGWSDMLSVFPFLRSLGLANIDPSSMALAISFVLLIMQLLWAAPCGWLGDRFGKKNIFALGLLVMGVSALFCAFATTIPQILFYLIFLAFGNAAQTVLFGVYLADLIPAERVGEFSGLSATAETGGVFLSIIVAGALINLNLYGLQYRMIFILTGVFLFLAVLALRFVKPRLTGPAAELPAAVASET